MGLSLEGSGSRDLPQGSGFFVYRVSWNCVGSDRVGAVKHHVPIDSLHMCTFSAKYTAKP